MSSLKVISNQWQRPQTSVYENNFGYAVNFYQPMIDYLDEKRSKGNARYPHLPYTDERALPPYDPSKKIKPYTEQEIQELAKDTDRIVRKGLAKIGTKRSNVLRRSASGGELVDLGKNNLSKSSSAANVSSQNFAQNEQVVMRRTKVRVNRQVVSANLEQLDVTSSKPPINPMRGKSAKAIETQLLQQTEQNLDVQRKLERSKSAMELPVRSFKQVLQEKMKDDKDDLQDALGSLTLVKNDLVGFCDRNFRQVTDQR